MIKKIEFRACISPIMSGIRIGGDMMRVQFDIPKSDIQDAVPLLALTDTGLRITVEVDNSPVATRGERDKPKREKKPEQPKGPHSSFWHSFCAGGRFNSLDLWQVLGAQDAKSAEDAFRQAFGVSSRTFISPQDFILWLDKNELNYLATQARRITAEAGL